jgi:hypothetical protein
MSKPAHARVLDLLLQRQTKSLATKVVLRSGRELMVYNVAWGYDMDDAVAHITTNISPNVPDVGMDFFFASDVVQIVDPENGALWFEA